MKYKIETYLSKWMRQGYNKGIPETADPKLESLNKAPSYRAICRAILRNDLALQSLGFSKEKSDAYCLLKRIEIEARSERLPGCD